MKLHGYVEWVKEQVFEEKLSHTRNGETNMTYDTSKSGDQLIKQHANYEFYWELNCFFDDQKEGINYLEDFEEDYPRIGSFCSKRIRKRKR